MTPRPPARALLLALAALSACQTPDGSRTLAKPRPAAQPQSVGIVPADGSAEAQARAVIAAGTGVPAPDLAPPRVAPLPGDISINLPNADVQDAARAVLGDILKAQYTIDPALHVPINLVTPRPVARASVLPLFEEALRAADLTLLSVNGGLRIAAAAQAAPQANIVDAASVGYGAETIPLQYIAAAELKRLIDPILPGVVVEGGSPTALTIKGTTGQRASVRELVKQFDVNWLRNTSFALFIPQKTDARLIVPELDKLVNAPDAPTRGLIRLIAMEKLNGILTIATQAQYLEDVRRWVDILDREGQNNEKRLFVYRVQNGRSADLSKTLIAAFGGGGTPQKAVDGAEADPNALAPADQGARAPAPPPPAAQPKTDSSGAAANSGVLAGLDASITSDDANNAIIVFSTPRDFAVVEDALRKLDVPPVQILIEAAITEVTLNNNLRYGVQWAFQNGDADFRLSNSDSSNGGIGGLVRQFPGFSFFYSARSISATLNALEDVTHINVVAAPKLLVLNNQTASLQIGDQVPIASGSAVSVQNPGAPLVNTINYRDTGVILTITPRVNSSGSVLLDVAQEVSSVSTTRTSSINSPTISTRKVSSSIAVRDGQTIALGGLIQTRDTRGRSGLPFLSRIPVLGSLLFGTTDNALMRTELIVLLKPTVLRTVEDGQAATQELIDKIRSVRPLTANGEIQ